MVVVGGEFLSVADKLVDSSLYRPGLSFHSHAVASRHSGGVNIENPKHQTFTGESGVLPPPRLVRSNADDSKYVRGREGERATH